MEQGKLPALGSIFLFVKCLLSDFNFVHQVTTSIYNLILGKLYCDHYGTMHVQGNRDYSCKIKFKEQSIIDRNPHQVPFPCLKYHLSFLLV